MNKYFGFAIADGMFSQGTFKKEKINSAEAIGFALNSEFCGNPSHKATITAMSMRFGIHHDSIKIHEKPPMVHLTAGDEIVVMSVRGLPRLTDNRHYSDNEIANADFVFSKWTVVS